MFTWQTYADIVKPGISFQHNDWEIACDNTYTCRAAGYQGDEDDLAISVLLTRRAGANQSVEGKVMLGSYSDDDPLSDMPKIFKLTMTINGKKDGAVLIDKNNLVTDLSPTQVTDLITSLRHSSTITFSSGEHVWTLSDRGAAAVLLKMDEYQGRIGTTGALIRNGNKSEDSVFKSVPVPVIVSPSFPKIRPSDKKIVTTEALLNELKATVGSQGEDSDCLGLQEGDVHVELAERLSDKKLLVSAQCWLAAYNDGSGYWIINDVPPYDPELVTSSATDYGSGIITSTQKGRGLGDCWSTEGWTWDGKQFVHSESSTTGMCKLVAPGGAWTLPTIVTQVKAQN